MSADKSDLLEFHLRLHAEARPVLNGWVREMRLIRTPAVVPELSMFRTKAGRLRAWRADFAWPEHRLLVEVDGGQWAAHGGRHSRDSDRVKMNAAVLLGWRVLRFSTQQLEVDPDSVIDIIVFALESSHA